jgi:tungstate transport system ATP-binding protein
MLYEIENLAKVYDNRNVLDLSLSLEKGKVTCFLGSNGAGKTTLLEILAFISHPTSGVMRYNGSRVDFGKTDLVGLRKGAVLLQQKPILFSTSVFNNLEFPLKIRNVEKIEREKIVKQLLSLVGIERLGQAGANKLSGGETQRVAIAQALACSPEVILMDEPTTSIDVENQIIIEGIIREINRSRGISVIFTTHDRLQASRLADNVLFLHEGRLSRSINENIFGGAIEKDMGNIFCVIMNGLKIPVKTEKTGLARISIDPAGVKIFKVKDYAESGYKVKGKVIQLTDEKEYIRALVDIGVPLNIIIERNDYKADLHGIGEEVLLAFAPEKIEVF